MWGSPEQWFEVTRWINDSGAAVVTGKLLCIHRTRNHSFLYCFKLLNNIISNTSHDDQQAHWNFIGISKCVDFSRQSDEETAMMMEPNIPVPASTALVSQSIPFPHCWLRGHFPPLRARQVSLECPELSFLHPAWHYHASDFILMHEQWQVVAKLWRHQNQWVNSSWISVLLPTDRYHGSSKECIPLW